LTFLYFNLARDLAVFYGRNRLDYYVSEGLPLLLTTALPFVVWGGYGVLSLSSAQGQDGQTRGSKVKLRSLLHAVLFMTVALTMISHKEVRFLYPLLPALLVIAAGPVSKFFGRRNAIRDAILVVLVGFNIGLGWYVTQVHQRGVIDVMHYLREKHEAHVLVEGPSALTSVGFLMPCHSTPWRSHLVHKNIHSWALTCEPPLDVPLDARASYLDEADEFYADPKVWLHDHMESHYTRRMRKGMDTKPWPDNFVFFEQLEPVIKEFLYGTIYRECWRGFNTHWHDDWRRNGEVIVWCRDR
jgi:phosphatidylinositol glycan class B